MHRHRNAPQPRRRRRDLQAKSMERHLNNLADEHNFVDMHDTAPQFRWNECLRMLHTSFKERFLVVGDYGPPMYFLELSLMGKMMPVEDRPLQYAAFCAAEDLFRDQKETSHKWLLEAYLCMKLSQQEITLEIPLPLEVISMYEYYFFDIRAKDQGEIVQYINAECDYSDHDGVAKYLATLWGPRLFRHYRFKFSTLQSEDDMLEARNMIQRQTLTAITNSVLRPGTSLERHVNIATMALKEKIVNFKIAQDPATIKPKGLGATGDALDGEFHRLSTLHQTMTESEDVKALETGGRAAENSIADMKKTHMEAAMETITAPRDLLTPEERDSLRLDNGLG